MKNWYFDKKLKNGTLQWYHIMVLSPIEVMDGIYELKKVIKSSGEEMTRQFKQAFEWMASQFMGSRSFHHEETHKTINFGNLNYWLK